MTVLSPVIWIEGWIAAGIGWIAAGIVLFAGMALTLYFANRATEPVSFREMARPVVLGGVALAALGIVGLVLLWFLAAAFVTGTGCVWVAGVGGCVPWMPTPPTV